MSCLLKRILVLLTLLISLPALAEDRHGDWIKPGEFKGKKILVACYYWEGTAPAGVPMNNVPQVLRDMGFTVDILQSPAHLPDLSTYDELWVVSGTGSTVDKTDAARVRAFLKRGKGAYILADNTPYIYEANILGGELNGIHFDGGYYGGQMINVVSPGAVKKMVEEAMKKGDVGKLAELRRAGFLNGKLYAEDHELLSGITQIFEGITVAAITPLGPKGLEVIIRASDNQSLVAVSTVQGEKLIYDGGFTRLYANWETHATTSIQWYRNVAAYLMGRRRADLPQQAINP